MLSQAVVNAQLIPFENMHAFASLNDICMYYLHFDVPINPSSVDVERVFSASHGVGPGTELVPGPVAAPSNLSGSRDVMPVHTPSDVLTHRDDTSSIVHGSDEDDADVPDLIDLY